MADFTALKNSIRNYIKQNGNAEITGEVLQNILISMVVSMGDGAINGIADGLANEGNARTNADGLLQNAINSISAALGDGYTYAGIATPATTPASGRVFYLALQAGTYTNFGGLVVTQGINILKNNNGTWQLDNVIGIDDVPTNNSANLITSGGVALELNKINGLNKSGSATFEATGIKTLITDIDLPVGSKYTIDISASGLVWSSMFLFDQNDFAQSENTKNIPSVGKYTFTVKNNAITELRIYLVTASAFGTLSAVLTTEGELDKKADAEEFAEYVETKQVEDFSQNLANSKVFGKTVEKANTTSIKTSTPANGYYNIYGVFTEDNDFYYQSVVIDHSKCYHIVNDNQAFSIATLVLFGSNNEVLFIDNNRYVDEYFVFNNEVHHFAISRYVNSWSGVVLEESNIAVNKGGVIVNGHKEIGASSLASGGVLTLTNIPNVQKNKTISFYARINSFDGVTIRHGAHGDYANGIIKVDNTNVYLYVAVGDDSTPSSTIPHGLTINTFISILIDVNEWFEGKVTVTTLGGEFSTTFTTFMGSSGNITATSNGSSFTLAKLVFGCVDFTKNVWMFGDSYFVMWPYYAINKKHANFYQDGFAGRTAQDALTSLQNALQFGFIPKTIVWFMGMNNPDSGGVVNSAWQSSYESLKDICSKNGIELVLSTIPSTPTMNNDEKNAIVKNSGYRYIDISEAVGADISTSWYNGLLSSDNVHPTNTYSTSGLNGCVVIAARVMADLPEIKN